MPNVIFERPELSKSSPEANLAVVDRWIADTSDKLNYMLMQNTDAASEGKEGSDIRIISDYEKAMAITSKGAVPDCTVIAKMNENFLAGCDVIASAITAGRGEGAGGIDTAAGTSPEDMAENIKGMGERCYSDGIAFADDRVNEESASFLEGMRAGFEKAVREITGKTISLYVQDGIAKVGGDDDEYYVAQNQVVQSSAIATMDISESTIDVKLVYNDGWGLDVTGEIPVRLVATARSWANGFGTKSAATSFAISPMVFLEEGEEDGSNN